MTKLDAYWPEILDVVRQKVPQQTFNTWFLPLYPENSENGDYRVGCPNHFFMDWFSEHHLSALNEAGSVYFGENILFSLKVEEKSEKSDFLDKLEESATSVSSPESIPETKPVRPLNPGFATVATPTARVLPTPSPVTANNLNPDYNFQNFVVGSGTDLAFAAATAIANNPGSHFNPLFVHGGTGLGKTHLMQAIGNHVEENGFARKVLYVTSEQFTTDFIKSIQTRRSESFSRIYRNADVLLLDDVQFFMAKDKTQEEFFHTFNSLHQAGKQLVFSSDRSPNDLESFDERLISRLQWGLVAELRLPEYETRLAILKNFASDEKIELPDDIAHFLAIHVTDNVRSLQSALIHMLAQSSLIGRRITMELARDAIKNLGKQVFREMTVEQIQDVVARTLGIPADLLRSKTRKREVVFARQVAMHLAIEFTRLTLKAIGLHFGGRDHATVIHARDNIEQVIKRDHKKAELLADLRHKLELASL